MLLVKCRMPSNDIKQAGTARATLLNRGTNCLMCLIERIVEFVRVVAATMYVQCCELISVRCVPTWEFVTTHTSEYQSSGKYIAYVKARFSKALVTDRVERFIQTDRPVLDFLLN